MILAIDVHYKETYAKVVGVLFNWEDETTLKIITTIINDVKGYESGQFYKRELPCILQLLEEIDLDKIDCIIVDGHVFVNNAKAHGLGGHLYQSLNEKIPVIGVAKKSFYQTESVSHPVFRGNSKSPLYISAIGMNENDAQHLIKNMHGPNRIPALLKLIDSISKDHTNGQI